MNYVWVGIIVISIICALITGRMNELSESIISGAQGAITLIISLSGMMCLWTGFMRIAEEGGLTKKLSRLFSPILCHIFTDYDSDSKAMQAICMNITANLLGLGNAATPFGIEAMKEMQKIRKVGNKHYANNSMVLFVVMNTASLQILPTMLIVLRAQHGSSSPLEIMPAVWLTSVVSLIMGVIVAKTLQKRKRFN